MADLLDSLSIWSINSMSYIVMGILAEVLRAQKSVVISTMRILTMFAYLTILKHHSLSLILRLARFAKFQSLFDALNDQTYLAYEVSNDWSSDRRSFSKVVDSMSWNGTRLQIGQTFPDLVDYIYIYTYNITHILYTCILCMSLP